WFSHSGDRYDWVTQPNTFDLSSIDLGARYIRVIGSDYNDTIIDDGNLSLPVYFQEIGGNNLLEADTSDSTLAGGSGNDTLLGGSAPRIHLLAGSGSALEIAHGPWATLNGGSGPDQMIAVADHAYMQAGSGDATLL